MRADTNIAFKVGREPRLHAPLTWIYRLTAPVTVPLQESSGGCKSWIQLDHALAGDATPVFTDAAFDQQCDELSELLGVYANARL